MEDTAARRRVEAKPFARLVSRVILDSSSPVHFGPDLTVTSYGWHTTRQLDRLTAANCGPGSARVSTPQLLWSGREIRPR